MAKKKKSAYTRERNKLLAKIRYWNKKGYEVHITVPLTERQLRQEGIKGQDLRHQTDILKNQNKNFDRITMTSKADPNQDYRSRKELKEYTPSGEEKAYEIYQEFISRLERPIHYGGRADSVVDLSIERTGVVHHYAEQMAREKSPTEVGRALIERAYTDLWANIDGMMYDSTLNGVREAYDTIMGILSMALEGTMISKEVLGDMQQEAELYYDDMTEYW